MKRGSVRWAVATVAAIACVAAATGACAQAYPAKSIRLIVPWPPGGGADVLTRMLTPKLTEALGQLNRIIAEPEMRKRMLANGYEPVGGPPEKFGKHISAEIAKWAPVVKRAKVRVD